MISEKFNKRVFFLFIISFLKFYFNFNILIYRNDCKKIIFNKKIKDYIIKIIIKKNE